MTSDVLIITKRLKRYGGDMSCKEKKLTLSN